MAKKKSLYPSPSKQSKTKVGTPPNQSKSGKKKYRGRPSEFYNPVIKEWEQKK